MSDTDQAAPAPEPRVKFGPRPTQHMPREWAEHMLTELARTKGPLFRKLLGEAAIGGQNGGAR